MCMDFSIVTDTAGANVSELGTALRDLLTDKVNQKYDKYDISIGIAIRCLLRWNKMRSSLFHIWVTHD